MADWVWVESPGTRVEEMARLRVSQMGDGYQQAAPDGINFVVQSWPLQFDDVDDDEAALMVAFLRENAGLTFNYWPMWAAAPIKVRCDKWSRVLGSRLRTSTITATFEQMFQP